MTAYAELEDIKRFLRIPGVYEGSLNTEEDVSDDILLNMVLETASRTIDHACSRTFVAPGATASAKVFQPVRIDNKYRIYIPDLMTITDLVVKSAPNDDDVYSDTITDYRLYPLNAASEGKPWTEIVFDTGVSVGTTYSSVEVTAKWGWTTVPTVIKNATLLQAARFFKRKDAPFGIAGSVELGSEVRLLAKVDPDVAVMIRPYKRVWSAV